MDNCTGSNMRRTHGPKMRALFKLRHFCKKYTIFRLGRIQISAHPSGVRTDNPYYRGGARLVKHPPPNQATNPRPAALVVKATLFVIKGESDLHWLSPRLYMGGYKPTKGLWIGKAADWSFLRVFSPIPNTPPFLACWTFLFKGWKGSLQNC